MKIERLTEELIPVLVAERNLKADVEREIREDLESSEERGYAIFVRHEPGFIQRVWVTQRILEDPMFNEIVYDHGWWERGKAADIL